MTKSLEIENKLLLACARSELNTKYSSLISELLQGDIDWQSLIRLAAHHKLIPLLYKHLSSSWTDKVPAKIMAELRQFYGCNTLRNMQKLTALVQILHCFTTNNINAVSVKGPILTMQYFNDIGARPFSDLDILVSRQDFKKSVMLLKSMGYFFIPRNIPEQYFFYFAKKHHHGQLVDKYGVLVELHWEISGHYGKKILDLTFLNPFLEICPINGHNMATLCPEMLLVYLAMHAQRHSWQMYDYLVCFAEVLNKTKNMNWHVVTQLAVALKVERVVFLAVFMASELLDASVEKKIIQENKHAHFLSRVVEKHRANWRLINQTVIEKNKAGLQEWRRVYPQSLKFTGRVYDAVRQYYKQVFWPVAADWQRFPVPYKTRALYSFSHAVYALSRALGKHK